MPPSRAMQMAVAASVTVSMADETIGMARLIPGVSCVRDIDVLRNDVAVGRNQQHVIEGERFPKVTVRQHLGRLAERPPVRQGYLPGFRRRP